MLKVFNDDFRLEEHIADGSKSNTAKDRGTACVSIKDASSRLFSVIISRTFCTYQITHQMFSL